MTYGYDAHIKAKRIAWLSIGALGLIIGITALVVMGHDNRWADMHNELIATPLVVASFLATLISWLRFVFSFD